MEKNIVVNLMIMIILLLVSINYSLPKIEIRTTKSLACVFTKPTPLMINYRQLYEYSVRISEEISEIKKKKDYTVLQIAIWSTSSFISCFGMQL